MECVCDRVREGGRERESKRARDIKTDVTSQKERNVETGARQRTNER